MEVEIIPKDPNPTAEERNWATICHLAAFLGLIIPIFGYLIGPTVVWYLKRDQLPLVREQGKEAINFQITMTIAWIFCGLLGFILIGYLLLVPLAIFNAVSVVIAAVKTSSGINYRYPYSLRLIN